MKFRKTIAGTLVAASILGCTLISTGCDKSMFTNEEREAIEEIGEELAKEYFEDELGYKVKFCNAVKINGEARNFYLTTYVSGRYFTDDDVMYTYYLDIETGEVYTDEHLDEFTEIASKFVADEQDIDVSEVSIQLALDNAESEYFEQHCSEEYLFAPVFPADMDADDFEDFIKDPDNRNPIAVGVRGKVANSYDLSDIDLDFLEDLDDEYNMYFNLALENDYEYFSGDTDYYYYEHFIMIEKDDFTLLVTDKTYSYMKNRDDDKTYEATADEIIGNLDIKETDEGYKFEAKDLEGSFRFKLVAYEGDDILDKTVTSKKGQRNEIEWEETEEGFMVSKGAFVFGTTISIAD